MEQILITFVFFLLAAVLVEKLTEILGDRFPKMEKKTLSMIIGFVVALYANFNVLELIGIPFGWQTENDFLIIFSIAVGIICSGLILSTGANGVHDLLSKLQKSKDLTNARLDTYNKFEYPEGDVSAGSLQSGRIEITKEE